MAASTAQIDSAVEIITPENIAFRYRVAGPFRRFPAYVLDLLIRTALVASISVGLIFAGAFVGVIAIAIIIILHFVIEWFYGGFCETYFNGQTFGKRVMGIRVLSVDGHPITPIQAVLRNILRFVDMMPLLSWQVFGADAPVYAIPTFGMALVTAALSPKFQRVGDIVCGTIVVIEERKWLVGVAKLDDPRAAQLAGYIPMDFRISRSLARALAAYVDRRRFFSPARRREVAHHLAEPLLSQFGFPADTSYDLLLCALYYRAFVADRGDDDSGSPFMNGPAASSGLTGAVQPTGSSHPAALPNAMAATTNTASAASTSSPNH